MPAPRISPRGAGIEGKWGSLIEERETLREQVQELTAERDGLREELAARMASEAVKLTQVRAALEDVARREVPEGAIAPQGLVMIYEALKEAQEDARQVRENFSLELDDEEQEAMDAINNAFRIIVHRWKLRANSGELASAVHVIQGFIQQHMLVRLGKPGQWGDWWEQRKGAGNEVRKAAE